MCCKHRLYNNISPASALGQGSNYHLFKEGIEPKWEVRRLAVPILLACKVLISSVMQCCRIWRTKEEESGLCSSRQSSGGSIWTSAGCSQCWRLLERPWRPVMIFAGLWSGDFVKPLHIKRHWCSCFIFSIRKSQDKIAIWTKDQSPDFTRAIGKSFKRTLEIDQKVA